MKGLLIKDFALLFGQKRFFFTIILISVIIGFAANDPSFVIGYTTMVISIFSLSTISYDEFDNGAAFLFTLPISRKTYAAEKYVFAAALGLVSIVFSVILSLFIGTVTNTLSLSADTLTELSLSAVTILASALIMISVMIPIEIKFGAERGRVALIAVFGALFLVGFCMAKLFKISDSDISAILEAIEALSIWAFIAALILLVSLSVTVSYNISKAVITKKEY